MGLGDYLGGTRLTLVTDLPPYQVVAMINDHVRTAFKNRGTTASGWAGANRLWLWHRSRPIGSSGDRVLAGRIRPRGRGSVIHLHYRIPWPLAILSAAIVLGLAGYTLWTIIGYGSIAALLFFAAISLAPLAYLFPGEENANREMGNLMDFLCETLDARTPEREPPNE
jgi:hypothetical protein